MTGPRILVVDDNALNIRLASFVLSAAGMEVDSAAGAAEALEKLLVFAPDLILMDVQLPGVDGIALTRKLKADPAHRHVRIVAFTAYAMKGDEVKFLAAGCDGYLSKPINVATFAAQVQAMIAPSGPPP